MHFNTKDTFFEHSLNHLFDVNSALVEISYFWVSNRGKFTHVHSFYNISVPYKR